MRSAAPALHATSTDGSQPVTPMRSGHNYPENCGSCHTDACAHAPRLPDLLPALRPSPTSQATKKITAMIHSRQDQGNHEKYEDESNTGPYARSGGTASRSFWELHWSPPGQRPVATKPTARTSRPPSPGR